jgi:hypothetical protein
MPVAVGALSHLANRAGATNNDPAFGPRPPSAHYDTSQNIEMPIPQPTPAREPSDSSLRSRTFSHAHAQAQSQSSDQHPYGSLDRAGGPLSPNRPYGIQSNSQRSSSESIQSAGSGNGNGRWAEGSYEQINRDDLASMGSEGQAGRPSQGRRTSSGRWFSWGSGSGPGESRAKED